MRPPWIPALCRAQTRLRGCAEPFTLEEAELIASSPEVSAIVRKTMVTSCMDVLCWVRGESSGFPDAMNTLEAEQRHTRH